jgi:hypothetical protein
MPVGKNMLGRTQPRSPADQTFQPDFESIRFVSGPIEFYPAAVRVNNFSHQAEPQSNPAVVAFVIRLTPLQPRPNPGPRAT